MANSFEPMFGAAKTPGHGQGAAALNWVDALAGQHGFSADARFGLTPQDAAAMAEDARQAEHDAQIAQALAQAEENGRKSALAELEEEGRVAGKLGLSLSRMDEAMHEQLASRLAETVCALCEAAMAPLAIDKTALQKRCIDAAGMVGDGIIDASLRLHPEDIALLDTDFAATWHIVPDPDQERGSVQFDMAEGAVRDGPAQWRLALREALGLC